MFFSKCHQPVERICSAAAELCLEHKSHLHRPAQHRRGLLAHELLDGRLLTMPRTKFIVHRHDERVAAHDRVQRAVRGEEAAVLG